MKTALFYAAFAGLSLMPARQDADERLRVKLKDTGLVGSWIYDDIGRGYEEAKKSGKPLMVVIRCVP